MFCRVKCSDAFVLQFICDQLSELNIQYLAEMATLEIMIKSNPQLIEKLVETHKCKARLFVNT